MNTLIFTSKFVGFVKNICCICVLTQFKDLYSLGETPTLVLNNLVKC